MTTSATLQSLGEKVIRVLPPAMLVLVLLNVVFLGMTAWVLTHNAEQRNVLLTKIVESCLLDHHPR